MLILLLLGLASQTLAAPPPAKPGRAPRHFSRRCGWLDNPTPGNFFLRDREGEWTLAVQGGPEAEGMDSLPDLSGNEFVEINGHHGYACVCLDAAVDPKPRVILAIRRVKQQLLKSCLEDPDLAPMPRSAQ
jgi:hypothetical protein